MCKVSDQLKLCTCHAMEKKPKTHYWVLYGHHEEETLTVGEVMLPPMFTPQIHEHNHDILMRLLNQGDCFDFDAHLKEGDHLEIHLHVEPKQQKYFLSTCKSAGTQFVSYEFDYKNGKWVNANYNPFHNNLMQKLQGTIEHVFEENGPKD